MKIHHIPFIAAIMLAGQLANAQLPIKNDAAKKFKICTNSNVGVPTQLVFQSCIEAFGSLITAAQKTSDYTADERRLLWAQAGQSANLAVLLQIKMDNAATQQAALTDNVCNIALQGLKAYSQVKPKGTPQEMGGMFVEPASLINLYNNCQQKPLTWKDANKAFSKKDFARVEEILLKLGSAGDLKAMRFLALAYYNGQNYPKSYPKAMLWSKKYVNFKGARTESEYGLTLNLIGQMYYMGQGVGKSASASFPWFQKSANAGNDSAMVMLGIMYARGESVTKNRNTAIYWLKKAKALNGVSKKNAQTMLDKLGVSGN